MATNESIGFDFSALRVPPWARSEWELVYLPFPDDSDMVRHHLNPDLPFFSRPKEAFDEDGKNLIVFREKRLFLNERIGSRPLPAYPIRADLMQPELFSRIKLVGESPASLIDLLDMFGLIVSPLYDSQKRFIDARFDSTTGDPQLDYSALYPFSAEIDDEASDDLKDLAQAATDISEVQRTSLGGSCDLNEPFDDLGSGSVIEAVALSEYSRRVLCRTVPSASLGGIISYFEVLLTTRALFRSMGTLIDFSVAGSSVTKLTEQLEQRAKDGTASAYQRFALDEFASGKGRAVQRTHGALNILEPDVRESFDFVQRCSNAYGNTKYGSIVRKSNVPQEIFDNSFYQFRTGLEPVRDFYEDVEPRYLMGRYCEGSFSAALAAQFLSTLADPAPWKRCDNPECRVWFKHHFSGRNRTSSKATSCSPECSTRKRNRLYNMEATVIRAAAKRYKDPKQALAYIEQQLKGEFERVGDLQKARKRWIKKLHLHM